MSHGNPRACHAVLSGVGPAGRRARADLPIPFRIQEANPMHARIVGLALVALALTAACAAAPAQPVVVSNSPINGVQVSGEGSVQVAPDLALVRVGAQLTGKKPDDVQNQVSDLVSKAIDRI